ncbi:MAG TPA: hypothetical protein VGQ93_12370, partial [Lysobacter sp.]|nr:hypothetical protein [Lysobacter sp.]
CFGTVTYLAALIAVTVDVGFHAELMSGGLLMLRWQTTPGKHYRVEVKSTLSAPDWVALTPDITATSTTVSVTDQPGLDPRFYRIVLLD